MLLVTKVVKNWEAISIICSKDHATGNLLGQVLKVLRRWQMALGSPKFSTVFFNEQARDGAHFIDREGRFFHGAISIGKESKNK